MAARKNAWTEDDRGQFQRLCEIFCTKAEAASVMGVTNMSTFDRLIAENFPDTPTWSEAFGVYSAAGKVSLRRKQFELALKGDRTMLIWLGKQHLGQREPYKQTADANGSSGGEVQERQQDDEGGVRKFRSSHPELSVVRQVV